MSRKGMPSSSETVMAMALCDPCPLSASPVSMLTLPSSSSLMYVTEP